MHVPVLPNEDLRQLFDANYYETGLGLSYKRNDHWLNFFGLIADEIVRSLRPHTAFDAGCAMGMLVESLWDRGVESRGLDISSYAISQARRDMQPYCREASLVDPIDGRYDLVICIEVLEHLSPEQTEAAIANLVSVGDTILFSSSPSDFNEPTHFNVRPVIGWLKLFTDVGFWPDCTFDASFVAPHAILLRKQAPLSEDVLVLFSEKIRLKCALVEREQRIGGLNQKVTELTSSVNENVTLRHELEQACHELEQAHHELQTLTDGAKRISSELEALTHENRRISADQTVFRDENRKLSRELLVLRDENKRFSSELQRHEARNAEFSKKLLRAEGETVELASQVETYRAQAESLESHLVGSRIEVAQLQAELAHINRSAAWQFTRRYRGWIDRRREKSALVRLYDKTAKWLIRHTGFSADKTRRNAGDAQRSSQVDIQATLAESEPSNGEEISTPESSASSCDPTDEPDSIIRPADPHDASLVDPPIASIPVSATVKSDSSDPPITAAVQAVTPESESYESWYKRTEPSPELLHLQRALSRNLRLQPLISVLVPVYKVPLPVLQDMVGSVVSQTYYNWELCIVHGYPADAEGRAYLASIAATDSRIKLNLLEANHGISGNSNIALESVDGEFVALLDHDDILAPFALFQIASALNEHPEASFFYSDKDCISEDGRQRLRALFKPQWSPETMLSANYLTHLSVMRTATVRAVGGWRPETDGAQDWDIFLRVIDTGTEVVHVPGVLYHWRIIPTSVASGGLGAKPYATEAQIRTISDHLKRCKLPAEPRTDDTGLCRLQWTGSQQHCVSIILVSLSRDVCFVEEWAQRVDALAEWPNVEISAPTRSSSEPLGRARFTLINESDSLAAYLNRAVAESRGEYLVFLDSSVEFGQGQWLNELIGPLEDQEIAAVGAMLVDQTTGRILHNGLVFNRDGTLDYVFSNQPEHTFEQLGAATWYRNWSAVAGACFAVRREAFERAGGFQDNPEYPRHDVDLCLRLRTAGYRVLGNPFARFSQSRPSLLEAWLSPAGAQIGSAYFRQCFPLGDPYFHPQLESHSGNLRFASSSESIASHDYTALSSAFVCIFDADSELIEASKTTVGGPRRNGVQRLTWVLPEFDHAFYGGIHTILRFADYFLRSHQVESEFVFTGRTPERLMRSRVAAAFPDLAASCSITQLRNNADWDRVADSDATISTLWTTAYAALHFKNTGPKFYFVQDYESLFYPAGSAYALVEATYRFGFYGICNSQSLKDMYLEFGGEAEFFDPSIDPRYFFEAERSNHTSRPFRVFCYARPGHPRNCFELLSAAFVKLKERMGDQVQILSAGAEWNPCDYRLEGVVQNLGLLGYSATGALYRSCDAGVVMMMTRHPSYLPLELMACGALVITNENRYTRWLLEHEHNCLLSETTPGAMAETIQRGLNDTNLRRALIRQAAYQVSTRYTDWNSQAEKIYSYLVTKSLTRLHGKNSRLEMKASN